MKRVVKFIENLIEDMEDCMNWQILGIIEIEEVEKDNKKYAKVEGDTYLYKKQDNEYIRQWVGYCEDDYHGIILKPLQGNKYLKISYDC